MSSPSSPPTSVRLDSLEGTLVAIGAAILVATVATIWSRRQRLYQVPARDVSKGHRWFYPDNSNSPVYCNICELLINISGQCDSCGILADTPCMKSADKRLPCKPLTWLGPATKHHWIKGNLPLGSLCHVCNQECGADDGLSDFRCCWCQLTIHGSCRADQDDVCNLGRYRDCVVPPNCVRLKMMGWKGRRRFVVGEVKPPASDSWNPVIVVANRKSGNNDGERILQAFRGILNPVQVIDLCDLPLEAALEWCHLLPVNVSCRILVGGGDGTVGWVLDTIDRLKIKPSPRVAILPLGTGNDLSRVLGWGEGASGDVDVHDILHKLEIAESVQLDRWKITIHPASHLRLRLPKKVVYMNNYFSVGVDALVTLKFHQTRESKIYLYGSRLLNKFLFASFATKDVWERECKNLREKVSLWLDGKRVELPEIESIVILNIPSWGAGVQPWQLGSSSSVQEQRIDDNLLEVFGVYSIFHIAQMQVGLSEPVRLGQAKDVKVSISDKVPVQVDGEPWEQGAADIFVSFHCQATMLSCEA